MPKSLAVPRRGDPLLADWGRDLVRAINELYQGPEVCSPLIKLDGVVGLGEDYQVYHALTTSAVTARVGTYLGSGTFQIYADNGASSGTMLVNAKHPGNYTGYSISGTPFAANTWVYVALVNGRWKFLAADCSGVAAGTTGTVSVGTGTGTSASGGTGVATGVYLGIGSGSSVAGGAGLGFSAGLGLAGSSSSGGGGGGAPEE